jgi:hypothetical protein
LEKINRLPSQFGLVTFQQNTVIYNQRIMGEHCMAQNNTI